ncbi:MAG: LacI family DNA-binding transcriptional regulator [Chloroflexi bacterium]|nr:MAG: LacI family DNA-binding transcriptional regulator [Chloroflexota bacterium]
MTIVKVTERAVVYVGTVSRALNNDIHVVPNARERVSAVMPELGYVANLVKGMVDGLLLIPLRNTAGYMGTLMNTSFPLVLIDHQGTGSLCPDVGAQYGMPSEEPGGVDYANYRLPVCA